MHQYRVLEIQSAENLLTLQCSAGHHHLIGALNHVPPVGATLDGGKPHLGFGILACPRSQLIYRVIFERVIFERVSSPEPELESSSITAVRHAPLARGPHSGAPRQ